MGGTRSLSSSGRFTLGQHGERLGAGRQGEPRPWLTRAGRWRSWGSGRGQGGKGTAGKERASGAGTGRTQGPIRGGRASGCRIPRARRSLRRGFRRRSSCAWLISHHPPDPPKQGPAPRSGGTRPALFGSSYVVQCVCESQGWECGPEEPHLGHSCGMSESIFTHLKGTLSPPLSQP